ncbi:MAG: hypothetical protein [Caudoviricetes sp.]|nr:MAG: hypothetical protein [Caudoviricetes sp.]
MRIGAVVGAFVLLLALLCGVSWYALALHTRAGIAEGKVTALTSQLNAATERTGRIQRAVQTVEAERNEAQQRLRKALENHRDWAVSPAPAGVSDELCKRLKCTGVHPVPTPDR